MTPVDRFGVALSGRALHRHAAFEGKRIGDFGCGYHATFTRSVLARVQHATLIDVSLDDELHRNAKVTVIEGSLVDALPEVPSASLDVVMCMSVLEHLWAPDLALAEFHRILAPGGVALLGVPTWFGKRWLELSAFRLNLSPPAEMDDHKNYYDPRDLWPMLVRAGFLPSHITCRRFKFGLGTFAACRTAPASATDPATDSGVPA